MAFPTRLKVGAQVRHGYLTDISTCPILAVRPGVTVSWPAEYQSNGSLLDD